MTVNTELSKRIYTGNGVATDYDYDFKIPLAGDLAVSLFDLNGVELPQVLNTDYTVTGAGGDNGGKVLFTVPPPNGYTILLLSDATYTQPTDFKNQGRFFPETHENAIDRAVILSRQNREAISRSLTLPAQVSGVSTALPIPESLRLIGWNDSANSLRNFALSELATTLAFSNFTFDRYTATAGQTAFVLSSDPGAIGNLDVSIDGVQQVPLDDYTLALNIVTFTAPLAGGERVLIRYGTALPAGVGSVFSTKTITATDGQTVFDIGDSYVGGVGAIAIYCDGLRLRAGADYVETSASVVTLTTPALDGQEFDFVYSQGVSSAAADSTAVRYLPPFTGGVQRSGQDKWSEVVSVKDFGAVGDGVTDDSAAIQLGIEAIAALGGGALYFPAGQYYVPNNGTALRIKSSIRIFGAGMNQSVIRYNDSASTSRRDCFRVFNDTGDFDITFDGIAIQSEWGTGDYTQRSHLMELHTTGSVNIRDCLFSDSRYFNVVVSGAERVHITGSEFYRSVADGIHCSGCTNVTVDGNFFQFINDDAIAVHTSDADSSPVDGGIVISNNRIVDSQGIATLGGKHVTITGNSITRAHTRAISVGAPGSVEGNTAVLSATITGNVIDTVIDGSIFSGASGSSVWYIVVTSAAPTTNGSGYVGQRDGAGGIVSPFPYFYTNDTDASPPVAGNWNVNITGNTCTRSLGPVAQYSDYGFGTRIGRSGPANPAVTAANLGSTFPQIHIRNHAQNLNVAGNVLWGGGYGIHLDGTASSAYLSWRNVTINGNQIANFVTAGIYCEGEGVATLKNNILDGDPLHVHAQRLPNGKWTSNTDALSGIWVAGMNIASVGNEFRNLGAIYRGATPNESAWGCNVVYCDPAVAVGWDANNIGIGNVQRALLIDSRIVIEDGDPASATYGQVLNVCQNGATVLPTTGKYPIGWYVRNTAPAVAGAASSQYIIQGWMRMTTGTGHVLNTDWREMRTLTGT